MVCRSAGLQQLQVLPRRAVHAAQRDGLVEGDQAPTVLHREAEQVEIRDLVVALDPVEVEEIVITQGNVVGPERMVEQVAQASPSFARTGCRGGTPRRL
jgi:hypothetical protein